jgi:hypothetical protein
MGVMLILGRDEDPCCRLVHEQLTGRGRDAVMLSEDRLFPGLSFAWKPGPGRQGHIDYGCRRVDFTDIDAVLCRAWGVPIAAEDFDTADGRYICAEWNALLVAWLQEMPCVVVNRLKPQLWYKTQLNTADLAALLPKMPLKLPRSLVTTDIDEATEFCRSARGRVRYSPLTRLSQYRVQTGADREELASLSRTLPLHLTDWIEGRAIDAFVVCSEVMFWDGDDQPSDKRCAAAAPHCVEVAEALGLTFCKLSLVEASDGDWYCFDVDRAPQLYQCTTELQLQIAQALARVLSAV